MAPVSNNISRNQQDLEISIRVHQIKKKRFGHYIIYIIY